MSKTVKDHSYHSDVVRRIIALIEDLPAYLPQSARRYLTWLGPLYKIIKRGIFRLLPRQTMKTPWGPMIIVDPRNHVERGLARGSFEERVVEWFIEQYQGQEIHFVDIGANIGFYAILFLNISGPDGSVDAFEPLESNRGKLISNMKLNNIDDITIYPIGCSDKSTVGTLWVPNSNMGEASLARKSSSTEPSYSTEVELEPLDEIYPKRDGTIPDVLKIDVEGAELQVLRGGEKFLKNHKPDLILELHESLLGEFGDSMEGLVSLLKLMEYANVYHIESEQFFNVEELPRAAKEWSEGLDLHFFITE